MHVAQETKTRYATLLMGFALSSANPLSNVEPNTITEMGKDLKTFAKEVDRLKRLFTDFGILNGDGTTETHAVDPASIDALQAPEVEEAGKPPRPTFVESLRCGS